MTLQELRFIVALARDKHFGKASQASYVSQPTLSVAIQKLENELGVTIFERNKNDVRATPLGKDIVERAKRVLQEIEGIKQVAKFDQDQMTQIFKLGAIFTVGPYLIPRLINELNKLAPQLPLEIHEDYTTNLKEKLLSGDLDAILISLPFKVSGIETKILYTEPFVVLMPQDYPLARSKIINENILNEHNVLLLGEGHCFREQVIASCPNCFSKKKSHFGVNWRTVEGSSLETIRHMVAANMGLTILPLSAAKTGPYQGNLLTTRPLKGSKPARVVAMAWRKGFARQKVIEIILQALNSQSDKLVK